MKPHTLIALSLSLTLAAAMLGACATMPVGNPSVPQPAKAVEPARYVGLWYEIGRYENRFEKDCAGVTAEYALKDDGKLSVRNTCRKGVPGGPANVANGQAKIVPDSRNAKLKVSFFGPFYADYWVLDRAEDYSWAIVGEPSGRYLWLLSRDARPSDATRQEIEGRAAAMGYDLKLLHRTVQ